MPPPPCRGTGAAPRACAVLASCLRHARNEGKLTSPPPPTSAPPRVGDEGREGRTAAPPPEDKVARWGGSGERVRDGPHHRARRRHAPCKPQRRGHRGSERRVRRATTGATRQALLPCRGTSAAPRACAVLATCLRRRTDSEGAPPPPPPSSPPTKERGEDSEGVARGHGGGTEDRRTCQWKRRAASGGDAKKKEKKKEPRTKQTNAPEEESEKTGTKTAASGGRPGRHGRAWDAGEVPGHGDIGAAKGNPPPSAAATPCAWVVLASCLRHACYTGKTTRTTRGMTIAERGPPPRGHRGRVGRQRKEGAGRTTRLCPKGARAVQAPTGGPPGVRPQER